MVSNWNFFVLKLIILLNIFAFKPLFLYFSELSRGVVLNWSGLDGKGHPYLRVKSHAAHTQRPEDYMRAKYTKLYGSHIFIIL